MLQFVKDIYACDNAPWKHLKAKIQYLLRSPLRAIFILVVNREPDERLKGKTRPHIECKKMTALKLAIRNAYNPRLADPNHRRGLLDPGVSSDMCIHGTDYTSQVEHILSVVGLPSIAYHRRYDNYEYFIPYHLEVSGYHLGNVRLDDLRANIIDQGLVKIQKTSHYQYVCGNKEPYKAYFNKHFGTKLCEDHFPDAFDLLLEKFQPDYVRYDGRKVRIILRGTTILDGVHRAAICKARKMVEVPCIQI